MTDNRAVKRWCLLAFTLAASARAYAYDVTLAWKYPSDSLGNVQKFNVYRSENGGPFTLSGSAPGPNTQINQSGLTDGITYSFRVTACNESYETDPSEEVSFINTPPVTRPTLGKLDMAKGTLNLSAKTGNVYVVEVSTDLKNWTPLPQFTAPSDNFNVTIPKAYMKMKQAFFRIKQVSGPLSANGLKAQWTEGLAVGEKAPKEAIPQIDLKPAEKLIDEQDIKKKDDATAHLS